MKKLDLQSVLFHGFAHFLADKRFELSLKRLDQIKSGAILSRNEQKMVLPTLGFTPEEYGKILWNGEDYISICQKSNEDNPQYNSNSFFEFIGEYGIGLILDKKLLNELEIRLSNCDDGEIQVKDKIDSKYFLGVLVGDMSDEFFIRYLENWPPISKEDITDHFIQINKVRKVLQQNGYEDLPIYSSIDGCIITNPKTIITTLQQRNNQLQDEELIK